MKDVIFIEYEILQSANYYFSGLIFFIAYKIISIIE